jgi:hypothetical protein
MNIQQKIAEISEEGELWKPCPEFEEKYLVSSHGRVMGIGTYNTCKKGELIKLHKKHGRNGYMQARFYDNGKAKTFEIHLLVAKAFIPNPNNLPMVNHIDEDKTNNHVENLEWCTNQYNVRYSSAKAVDVYTKDGEFVETLEAIADAAAKYNTEVSNISACCKRKYGTCAGYQFRYHGEQFAAKPPVTPRTTRRRHLGVKPREAYFVSIDEYKIDGSFVKTWPNVSSASREYNLPTTNISKCCKGQINTISGHIFLKHGESINERLLNMSNRKHKSKTEQKAYA